MHAEHFDFLDSGDSLSGPAPTSLVNCDTIMSLRKMAWTPDLRRLGFSRFQESWRVLHSEIPVAANLLVLPAIMFVWGGALWSSHNTSLPTLLFPLPPYPRWALFAMLRRGGEEVPPSNSWGSRGSRHLPRKRYRNASFSLTIRDETLGAKKSTQTFFVQSFSKTLRVMDVRAKNRGRPHQKVRFSAAPVMGRNFLTQGRPGARVRNVRGKSGPKSLCLCCFFLP